MRKWLAAFCFVVFTTGIALAYFPANCNEDHAALDYTDADAIVIGRVIKIERVMTEIKEAKRKEWETAYYATIKMGKVIKGELKKDDEIQMLEGVYWTKEEDNTDPNWVRQANTHPSAGLKIDGVFLLFIMHRGNQWTPRSCHCSIHSIESAVDEKTEKRKLVVVRGDALEKRSKPVDLDEFLKIKQSDAEATQKKIVEEEKNRKPLGENPATK
jgi:hypothetical protein